MFRGPYLQGHTDATMVQNLRCCERYTPGRLRTPAGQPLPLLPWHNDNNNIAFTCFLPPFNLNISSSDT